MHESSQAAGVTCLDANWFGMTHPYSFRCAHGHEWQRTRVYQRVNPRCPVCSTAAGWAKSQPKMVQKLTDGLQRLQDRARAKGGRCLSEEYLGSTEQHQFECAKGHAWATPAYSVLRGRWCRACSHDAQRLTLQDAQQAAQARGGRCLPDEYVNDASPLLWECKRGHTWRTALNGVRIAGTWCPECAHMAQITNRKSKALRRYVDGGKHLMGETPPEG